MASAGSTQAPPGPAAGVAGRVRRAGAPWPLLGLAALVGLLFASPFVYLAIRSVVSPESLAGALTEARTLAPLARTLLLGASVAGASAVIGTAGAFLVTRTDLPGRRLAALLLPLPLVIPSFVAATVVIATFAPGGLAEGLLRPFGVGRMPLVSGFWWTFVTLSLITYPYVYLPVAARLRHLSPSLEESARTLGRRPAEVFRTVVLPQAKGAVLAGALLTFLYTISEFGAVSLLRYDTVTRAIYVSRVLDPPVSLTLSFLLGVLALVVVWGERARTQSARSDESPRGNRGLHVPLGRWKPAATAFLATVLGLSVAVPVGVLGFWAVRGVLRGSTRPGAVVTHMGSLLSPALNTAFVSIGAAVVAVAVVVPVAYLTVRHRSRVGDASHALVVAGFALPGLSLALALVYWTVPTPLYETLPLLVFAYVVHFGAQALRAAQVAVAGVPRRMDEAARALGARWIRRVRTIDLPLMAPGLLAGGGLVLLSAMKELPATLLLAPAGFDTLARKIWSAAQDGFLADASVASLMLLVVSGVLTWLLVIRRAHLLD